ncbi:uncharacterized protein [Procambarus clarkii]|uniref:uncharacterized protein isoform X2 n=1 Tax=Procambarus clarkii TaxID=6728 RepID=UPI003744B05D
MVGVMMVMVMVVTVTVVTAQRPGPSSSRVLVMQETGQPSAKTYARLLTPLPPINFPFTVCYRIYMYRFREESTLISYAVDNARDNELRIDHRVTGYKVALHSLWTNAAVVTPIRYWTHCCFAVDLASGNWSVFLNGEKADSGVLPPDLGALEGGGVLVVGQEQDVLSGGFQPEQSFSGEFTELNIWREVLEEDSIRQLAACVVYVEGDVLGWSRQSWQTLGGVSWVSRPRDAVCDHSTRRLTFFPHRYSLSQARRLCQVVGGQVGVPLSTSENTWLYQRTVESAEYCSGGHGAAYLWLGAHDQHQERQWAYFSGAPLQWEGPWRGTGPNGEGAENCLVMLYDEFPARWSDIACLDSYTFCVACEFVQRSTLHLRGPGVCDSSPFNREYILEGESGGRPALSGFFHSDITWDAQAGHWEMTSLKVPGAVARWTPVTSDQYPFGTKPWTLGQDVCGLRAGDQVNMTLSVCRQGQFTCADGTCIDFQRRCDLHEDCPDHSDEAQCSTVVVPDGYRAYLPPPPPTPQHPLPVTFSINVITFPSMMANDLTFTTTLQLRLAWRDSRLRYLNLKKDSSLNQLSREAAAGSIWTPRVFFKNAHGNVFSTLGEGARVECLREGQPQVGAPDLPQERYIYTGSENTLQMTQVYSAAYTCDFHLGMFPFDVQVCTLNFTLMSASSQLLTLQPGQAIYSGTTQLLEYTVDGVTMQTGREGHQSTIAVRIRFSRRCGFYILTVYLPTTFIMVVAYSTFFFRLSNFLARIVVALLTLLVLSSVYTQTTSGLPKTAYLKMLDVWLFFAIVVIFVVVVFHVMIEYTLADPQPHATRNCVANGVAHGLANGGLTRTTGQRALSYKNGLAGTDPEPLEDYPPVRRPDYPGGPRPLPNHLLILMAGRISVPVTFGIFNIVYWGSAMGEAEESPT